LYLIKQLGFPDATVVRLGMVTMGGGAAASLLVGWLSDRVGSRPILMPAATLGIAIPLGWMLLPADAPHFMPWCIALHALWGVATNSIIIASTRLLFNRVVPPERSTAYTSLYYAFFGVAGGIAPLFAGWLLKHTAAASFTLFRHAFTGYDILFAIAAFFLAVGAFLYRRVPPDDRHTTRTALRRLFARSSAT
ncbi:MAG: MFS transporter, partial [Kiritimatiellaeota bacterium]|nr:MFS transporter [Kiritimatiellota bacterium]